MLEYNKNMKEKLNAIKEDFINITESTFIAAKTI